MASAALALLEGLQSARALVRTAAEMLSPSLSSGATYQSAHLKCQRNIKSETRVVTFAHTHSLGLTHKQLPAS